MKYNQLSRYGAMAKFLPYLGVAGKIFILATSSDTELGNLQEAYPTDPDGVVRVYTDLATAVGQMTAGRGDVLVVHPGTYTLTAAVSPVANSTIIAERESTSKFPNVRFSGNVTSLIALNSADIHIQGVEFFASGTSVTQLVNLASTANVSGAALVNCVFNGNLQGTTTGLALNSAFTPTGLVVKGCIFKNLGGNAMEVGAFGMPSALIAENVFSIDTLGKTCINMLSSSSFASAKGWVIRNNDFIGDQSNATPTAITLAGTEHTTGAGIIRDNSFSYCNPTPITPAKLPNAIIRNFVGDRTSGGTQANGGT